MHKSSQRNAAIVFAILVSLLSGIVAPQAALAFASSTINKLFFIANSGLGDRLFSASSNPTSVQSPTAIPSSSPLTGMYRSLATDGTYLYFSDGTNLVRTDLDGTGKTTIVAGVASPEQIVLQGNYLYYSSFGSGVYSVLKNGGSPTLIVTNGANYGWDGVAIDGNTLYAVNYQAGLYIAQLNGTGGVTGTPALNADSGVKSLSKLLASEGVLYATSGSNGLIWRTVDATQPRSGWGSINIGAATSNSPYALAIDGNTLYFSVSNGLIGQVPANGSAQAESLSSGQFSSAWSLAVVPQYSVTYAAGGANSGTVPIDGSSPYQSGSTVTVLGNTGNLTKTNYQFYAWYNGTSNRSPGTTFSITSNTTFTATWVGGPLVYSLTPGGSAITTAAFPNTAVGSSSTLDIYVRNTGAAVDVNSGGISPAQLSVDPSTTTCATPGGSTVYAAGSECRMTVKWSPTSTGALSSAYRSLFYGLTNQINFTGTAVQASRVPTFDTPVKTADGFTVNVTNWDGSWTWASTVGSGSVVAGTGSGSTLPLTVTGLGAGAPATITVTTSRSGYANGSSTVSGQALSAALTPSLSSPVQTFDGFTVTVTNWDPSWTWNVTTGSGTVTVSSPSGSTLPITVSGLPQGGAVVLTVTNSRSGYVNGVTTVSASAATAATPSGGALPLTGLNISATAAISALLVSGAMVLLFRRRRFSQ